MPSLILTINNDKKLILKMNVHYHLNKKGKEYCKSICKYVVFDMYKCKKKTNVAHTCRKKIHKINSSKVPSNT